MVDIGSGAERDIGDIRLTRFACYLVVMNGDPRKEPIAHDIADKKGLNENQEILDYMGSVELAANLFRITQTEDALTKKR